MSGPSSKASVKRLTGSKVGKYALEEILGTGGYGEVYVGKPANGRAVAVKVLAALHARDDDSVERFKREAETARKLEHPNIVRVLDVGSSRQRHYLVMELVRGGSLHKLLRKGDADPEKLLAVLADSARGLAYAHERGVVHRDVKPGNILLTRTGKAKVADFGLARAVDNSSMTTEGKLIGTASYMSPEQAKGGRATSAADVYSMGVMIYETVSGRLPFESDTQLGFLYQHAEVEAPRPTIKLPFPPALGALVLECLAKDPKARPTMQQVADRLAAMQLVRPSRLPRILAYTGAALLALVLLLIAVPAVFDPLCGDWFGGGPFRALRGAAEAAHHALFGQIGPPPR
jgi:eukaryotic-like serine/threonine-protein kinase